MHCNTNAHLTGRGNGLHQQPEPDMYCSYCLLHQLHQLLHRLHQYDSSLLDPLLSVDTLTSTRRSAHRGAQCLSAAHLESAGSSGRQLRVGQQQWAPHRAMLLLLHSQLGLHASQLSFLPLLLQSPALCIQASLIAADCILSCSQLIC